MNEPSDQSYRTRFAREIDRNFSVVASAGAGKTHAITERILAIAMSPHALDWLPQLVVVTFTNRAADEMQQRARQKLLENGVPLEVNEAFNRAFFGTIHSFCLKLLRTHGHRLGLPSQPDVITDDTPLWREFVQHSTVIGHSLDARHRQTLFRFVSATTVMELGRRTELAGHIPVPPGECPKVDLSELRAHVAKRADVQANIDRSRRAAEEWERVLNETTDFAPLPEVSGGARDLVALWNSTFAPLKRWIQQAALCVGSEVAREFQKFRFERGALTYDDQVTLARQLFDDREVARRIREKGYRIMLDEAQDTDPEQFSVLLEAARSPEAEGGWPDAEGGPRAGHFCMVGDFQQSIYGQRADLRYYRRIHEALIRDGVGEALPFSVTFRLDEELVGFVNRAFPRVFSPTEGQVPFQKLEPRPQVLPGQVMRITPPEADSMLEGMEIQHEAAGVAKWIKGTGLEGLRAEKWSDVAIICPRKSWFSSLRVALRQQDFDVQLQSEREVRGEHPSVAWFTALMVVMAEPRNAFELVGVLREMYGLSDDDLARFTMGKSERLNIAEKPEGRGAVAKALRQLYEARESTLAEPLLTQVQSVVKATELRARLLSLPAEEYEGLGEVLDELLLGAAAIESQGLSLKAFADRLREDFDKVREARSVRENAIQIITGHKSKGSEWPVVIVPYFARKVGNASPQYPMVLRDEADNPVVVFDKEDRESAGAKLAERRARQEAERLLYVTLTRARHTLVLVEDRPLFMQKKGLPKESQASVFRLEDGSENDAEFKALPSATMPCPQTERVRRERLAQRAEEGSVMSLGELDPAMLTKASAKARVFLKRNPSGMILPPSRAALMDATKLPEPTPPSMSPDYPGKAYGTWWHGLIEMLDLRAKAQDWQAFFERELRRSPDIERSSREWPLFVERIAKQPEIHVPGAIHHVEMPFLWRMNDRECVEGIIDLAIVDPRDGSWLIVDWKTNRIEPSQVASLRERYEPQLSAYRAAIMAMTGVQVRAAIYSTTTGDWIPYDDAVLDARWRELQVDSEQLEEALCV